MSKKKAVKREFKIKTFFQACIFTVILLVVWIWFITSDDNVIANILAIIALILHWVAWPMATPEILGYELKGSETYKSGEHYETTFRSDGTAVTKTVDEYSGGYYTDCPKIYCVLAAIFGPLFFLPIFLFKLLFKH